MQPVRCGRRLERRAFLGICSAPAAAAAARWAEFLGAGGRSLPDSGAVPLEWSDRRNVAWRVPLPAYGQSCPVAWDSAAFVTGVAGARKDALLLTSFDLASGEPRWTRRAAPSQRIEDSDMVSKAAPTPAVDASAVYAFFETGNVLAFDHRGEPVWERRLTEEFGDFGGRHGIGSSLRLCRAGVLALAAHDGPSYLICLDRATGQTVWKADRPRGVSWSTPTVMRRGNREIALVSAGSAVEAYDTDDGSLLWTLDGLEGAFIASPVPLAEGALIGSSSKGQNLAVRFGQDLAQAPEVLWRAAEGSSYFSSPLAHRDRVYMVNKAGVAFCLRAESGQAIWHSRLEGQCWASHLGLGDRVYFFGVDGVVEVIRAGDAYERVARNKLSGTGRLYGAALSDQGLLLRFGQELALVSAS